MSEGTGEQNNVEKQKQLKQNKTGGPKSCMKVQETPKLIGSSADVSGYGHIKNVHLLK